MDRILAGQVALIEEPGIDLRFPYIVMNLDSDADLLAELTNPDAPPHITLLSWPGSSDRIVLIDELGHGGLSSQRDNSIWGSAM